jgi:hypothetical protein
VDSATRVSDRIGSLIRRVAALQACAQTSYDQGCLTLDSVFEHAAHDPAEEPSEHVNL